jgi:hypothetical protein
MAAYKNEVVDQVIKDMAREIRKKNKWIADMQSGLYINCVYCGHRYPPGTPAVRDKALYEHIKKCPQHPLKKAHDLIRSMMTTLDTIMEDEGADMYNIKDLLKKGKELTK